MPTDNLEVVIMAAGLGTRMKSSTVKVLHRAAGRHIVEYVLDLAAEVSARRPLSSWPSAEAVPQALGERARSTPWQEQQIGNRHAVMKTAPFSRRPRREESVILSVDVRSPAGDPRN